MIVNISDPTYRCNFTKPMDILSAILYLSYGIESGLCDRGRYDNSFEYPGNTKVDELKRIYVELIGSTRKDIKLLDYHDDYSELFYSTGRLILSGIMLEKYSTRFKDENIEEISGITLGLLNDFSTVAYRQFNKLLSDFSKDGIDNSSTPLLNVNPYFEDDILSLNHSMIVPIINSGIFFSILGSFMGILNNLQIKELFSYGDDSEERISGTGVINHILTEYKIAPEKFYSIGQFCMLFNLITIYLEKSIGIKFNDRFTVIFKAIGRDFENIYDIRLNITEDVDFKDIVLSETNFIHDRMLAMFREVLKTTSQFYIGDHSYDLRPMYMKYLLRSGISYIPPLVEILKYDVNLDFSNICNYKSTIDAHAYERLIKKILLLQKTLFETTSNVEYVESWYSLRYFEKYLFNIYSYWINSKTPFKIDGVDDIYVVVDAYSDTTNKEMRPINTVQYSIAIERTMDIIESLNARYCEAQEYLYSLKSGSPFNSEYYSRLDKILIGHIQHDSILDAARDNQYGKLPYIASLASFDQKSIDVEAINGNVDLKKLHKLDILDKGYIDTNRSVSRTPYYIMEDGSFNNLILEGAGGESLSATIADVLKGLTNHEHLYLTR